MKVKSLIGRHAGSILDVPHKVGENLILQGQAEAVADEDMETDAEGDELTTEETADLAPDGERAVSRGRKKAPIKKK